MQIYIGVPHRRSSLSSSICSPTTSIFESVTQPGTPTTPGFPTSHPTHSALPCQPLASTSEQECTSTSTLKPDPAESQGPRLFHRFNNLPPELRGRIWVFTPPQKRTLELLYKPLSEASYWGEKTGFTSTTPVPVTLQVCREARKLAQKMGFELTFAVLYKEPKVWFRTGVDVLWFRCGASARHVGERDRGDKSGLEGYKRFNEVVTLVDQKTLGKVGGIAVEARLFGENRSDLVPFAGWPHECEVIDEDWRMVEFWKSIKRKFAGLEEITFHLTGGEGSRGDGGERGREPSFPGVFSPVEWLRQRELKERARRLHWRIENAVGLVDWQGMVANGSDKWTGPQWRIEEMEEWGAG